MDVFTAIKGRRSVRAYQEREIEEEKLNKVLEAGRLAPSASNRQEWKFIVVKDEQTRRKLGQAANGQGFVGEAPVVIVICATETQHVMPCGQLSYPIDLAIATDHMTLEAYELGLGTCWIGAFHEAKVKEILSIPDNIRVPILFPLGYPSHKSSPKPRKNLSEVVSYEKYQ